MIKEAKSKHYVDILFKKQTFTPDCNSCLQKWMQEATYLSILQILLDSGARQQSDVMRRRAWWRRRQECVWFAVFRSEKGDGKSSRLPSGIKPPGPAPDFLFLLPG